MARPVIYATAAEAVADVFDGAMIALGGFTAALGAPKELFRALVETTACKDLTFIGNGTPQVAIGDISERRMLPMPVERLRKVICSFPGGQSTRGGFVNPLQEAFATGQVELELVPQGTLAERLRAGGAGIPAFFTPTGAGTRFAEGKEQREYEGRQYVLERWLRPDFALVHAVRADTMGNLVYRNTARNFNPPMAAAARCTIAEVDEIVEAGEIDPHHVVTPGIHVRRLVLLTSNK
jgi:3-oxoadipate CoA-transferase alpha subunit